VQCAGVATFYTGPSDVWRLNGGRLHCSFKTTPKLFDILLDAQTEDKESSFVFLRSVADRVNNLVGATLSIMVPFSLPEDASQWTRMDAIGLKAAQRPQNVILISMDSLRADHLGCYGYSKNTSPNLDVMASRSLLFENAISQAPWTLPAHASLLCSQYPSTHGVTRSRRKLGSASKTLSAHLKSEGYYTGAIVSGPYMKRLYGFAQGFHDYDDELAVTEDCHSVVTSPSIHNKIISFLDQRATRPFFLFLHYWDVHYDYNPPAPFDAMFDPNYQGTLNARDFEHNRAINANMDGDDLKHLIALYDGEIRFVDQYIGKLKQELKDRGLLKDTIIVITADHGDEFFEHGEKGHAQSLYEELTRVPLIIRIPNQRTGKKIKTPVALIDVGPTILDLLGMKRKKQWEGRSVLGNKAQERVIWSETERARKKKIPGTGRPAFCARMGDFKCIRYMKKGNKPAHTEAYDLSVDQEEQKPLPQDWFKNKGFDQLFFDWIKKRKKMQRHHENAILDSKTLETLKALGYGD